jgi:hypothetical protein
MASKSLVYREHKYFVEAELFFHLKSKPSHVSRIEPTSGIGTKRTSQPDRRMSAFRGKAEVGVGQLDFRV